MTHIIGEEERKKGYWRKRMHDRLNAAFDVFQVAANDMRGWSGAAGVDQEQLQQAFMIIAHGCSQVQGVILGQEVNAPKEPPKEEVKKEEEVKTDGK